MNTDYLLDYLIEQWTTVEDAIANWPEWDGEDRDAFALDWVISEERLSLLKEDIRSHGLDANQVERYIRLSKLIEKNSPSLHGLLAREYAVVGGCGRAPVRFRKSLPVSEIVEYTLEAANLPAMSVWGSFKERARRLKTGYRQIRSGGNGWANRRRGSALSLIHQLSRYAL